MLSLKNRILFSFKKDHGKRGATTPKFNLPGMSWFMGTGNS